MQLSRTFSGKGQNLQGIEAQNIFWRDLLPGKMFSCMAGTACFLYTKRCMQNVAFQMDWYKYTNTNTHDVVRYLKELKMDFCYIFAEFWREYGSFLQSSSVNCPI